MPSSRGDAPRASLLNQALLLITTIAISSTMAAIGQCPRSLDCAREGRHFCQPGSSHCGPCLAPLVENKKGKCVVRRRNHYKVDELPELDEEIDFLSSIITKHRESEMKHTAPSQVAPEVKEDPSQTGSHHRPVASPSHAPTGRPVTSALTTSSPTTSPSSPSPGPSTGSPFASAVQSAPIIIPYPSEEHSVISTFPNQYIYTSLIQYIQFLNL
uniref:Neural proliferation, differentiation and control, 1b n=1 Tax=Astyanax mexicanus TaxID=7994 RepID=A0A8B9JJ58_ASTMX